MPGIHREPGAWDQALRLAEEIRALAGPMTCPEGGSEAGALCRSATAVVAALAAGRACEPPAETIHALGIARRALADLAARAGIAQAFGRIADVSAISSRTDRLLDLIDVLIRSARKARRT